jgi:hypothetical protein
VGGGPATWRVEEKAAAWGWDRRLDRSRTLTFYPENISNLGVHVQSCLHSLFNVL